MEVETLRSVADARYFLHEGDALKKMVQFLSITLASVTCCALEPQLILRIHVPKEFAEATAQSPNGQSESSRYMDTFEAFWWNCVMVKTRSLALDCPFVASGTNSASHGAWDGATNADNQIKVLLQQNSPEVVQQYLGKLVSSPDVVMKFAKGRFKGNVTPQ